MNKLKVVKKYLLKALIFIFNYVRSNFKLSNAFSLDTALKIGFMYSSVVLSIIVLDCEPPPNFLLNLYKENYKNTRKMIVYAVNYRIGEDLLATRVLTAAQKLGWTTIRINANETLASVFPFNYFYYSAYYLIDLLFKPNFNISITHYVNIVPPGYSIVYLNVPTSLLFSYSGEFKYENLKHYNAYIDLYTLSNGSNKALEHALKLYNNSNAPIFPLYLSQNEIDFSFSSPRQSVITGSLWGCGRNSIRITNAIKKLAKDNLLVAYGLNDYEFIGQYYRGKIEKYGNPQEAIVKVIKEHGIALIIHNLEHMIEGIPTSRISEAIASGAIVISDKNKFIIDHFGDNILYFDALTSSEDIYQQIKAHIKWVLNNPKEAEKKAKRAYEILAEKFFLESQLKSIEQRLIELKIIKPIISSVSN